MLKSALRYELDKARYLDLETCSTPVLFSQNILNYTPLIFVVYYLLLQLLQLL